jgi:hypothetical protein
MARRRERSELAELLADHDPAVVALALALRSLILEEAPSANETAYDAGYAVSSFFSFTGKWTEAFCYVAAYARHVNLGFNRGADLPDPDRRLRGTGKQLRHLKIKTEDDLQKVYLKDLLRAAIARVQGPSPESR